MRKKLDLLFGGRTALGADEDEVMLHEGELTVESLDKASKGIVRRLVCPSCKEPFSREVKEKARQRGTLWEPGELQYQQTLQQSDPSAFKNLLERNGMHYDPNYRRGTG